MFLNVFFFQYMSGLLSFLDLKLILQECGAVAATARCTF